MFLSLKQWKILDARRYSVNTSELLPIYTLKNASGNPWIKVAIMHIYKQKDSKWQWYDIEQQDPISMDLTLSQLLTGKVRTNQN